MQKLLVDQYRLSIAALLPLCDSVATLLVAFGHVTGISKGNPFWIASEDIFDCIICTIDLISLSQRV